jgi:hypothetical protein
MTTNSRNEAVERATGRSWDDWLSWMASIDAEELSHHWRRVRQAGVR